MPEKKQSAWRFLWRSQDIRSKLLITLGILIIFRIAANIPVPGVDRDALAAFFQAQGGSGGFLGFLNLLSGGTIQNFSLLAMGVYPYITAQISPITDPHHSCPATQDAGGSTRRSPVDGEVDVLPRSSHGHVVCNRAD